MGKSQKFVFNTQKLDHDGNKMWVCIPWDNTFQLYSNSQISRNRSTFLLNAP